MKASVYIATSLDGFIARENGDLDWLPGSDGSSVDSNPEDGDLGYQAFMDSVNVLVMGRIGSGIPLFGPIIKDVQLRPVYSPMALYNASTL